MKVMITGADGMLGQDLVKVLSLQHEVVSSDIETLDITHLEDTIKSISNVKPEVVIHCAAYTDVDKSESNLDQAYKVNVHGTRNVAVACNKNGASLVYISTDYVFDGEKPHPYYEYDFTNPLSVYGKTKLAGELYVRDMLNQFYIVRTSWLYGLNGPNFVKTMLRLSKEMEMIPVVDDQIGSPTYTLDLARALNQLIEKPAYGIYHITNSEHCSWYTFAQEIFNLTGKEVQVNPVKTEEFPRPAPRPKNSILRNYNWEMEGFEPLRNYREALKDYLKS